MISESTQIAELYCPACGYDLRAIYSDRCPECGLDIDRSKLGESIIPWLHRKQIGFYRAFWRTCEMAVLRPGQFAQEMSCEAALVDAVKFRRLAVLHALLPFGLLLTYSGVQPAGRIWVPTDVVGSILQIASVLVGWVCFTAFLWGMSGSASFFFRPGSWSIIRQNRAVALSYYSCAPLAYLPATGLITAVMLFLLASQGTSLFLLLKAAVGLVAIVPLTTNLFLLITSPFAILRAIAQNQSGRRLMLAMGLPLIWLLWATITLAVLPAVWYAVVIMIISLQK